MDTKTSPTQKPKPDRVYSAKRRTCLMCRLVFESTWPGERVCRKCKATAGWRSG